MVINEHPVLKNIINKVIPLIKPEDVNFNYNRYSDDGFTFGTLDSLDKNALSMHGYISPFIKNSSFSFNYTHNSLLYTYILYDKSNTLTIDNTENLYRISLIDYNNELSESEIFVHELELKDKIDCLISYSIISELNKELFKYNIDPFSVSLTLHDIENPEEFIPKLLQIFIDNI